MQYCCIFFFLSVYEGCNTAAACYAIKIITFLVDHFPYSLMMSMMLEQTPVTNPSMPNAMMNMFFHRRQLNLPKPGSSQFVTRSTQLGRIRPKNDRHSAPTSDMTGPKSGTAMAVATKTDEKLDGLFVYRHTSTCLLCAHGVPCVRRETQTTARCQLIQELNQYFTYFGVK